jgi:inosine-uridine nucleoside N-ribohydrolase
MFNLESTQPEQLAIIADAGVDLDDEQALVLGAFLQRQGLIELRAVTANLKPAIERARLVRGTLDMLGYGTDLPDVPVGMGMGNIEKRNGEPTATKENTPYLADIGRLRMGDEAFIEILLDADPKSLTLILQSGFSDAAALAMLHGELLKDRIKHVVAMGGVKRTDSSIILENNMMTPDTANNNTFNEAGSEFLYRWCQEEGIPMTITTRDAAYAAQVPFKVFDDMQNTGNPIGASLAQRQYPSIRLLWKRANLAADDEERGPLPADRDREWFVNVFCNGQDPNEIQGNDDIVPFMGNVNLYDPLNLVAAVPILQEEFFRPTKVGIHNVIGLSKQNNGIIEGSGLGEFMHHSLVQGCRFGKLALKAANPQQLSMDTTPL